MKFLRALGTATIFMVVVIAVGLFFSAPAMLGQYWWGTPGLVWGLVISVAMMIVAFAIIIMATE